MGKMNKKKYIVSYKTGIWIIVVSIIFGLIVFSIFYFIQEKKDKEFENSRINIEAFKDSLENNK